MDDDINYMSSKCSFAKVVCDNLDSKGDHITLNKNLKTLGDTNTVTSYDQLTLASIDNWSTNGKDNQNRYIRMVYDTVLYPTSFSSFRPFQNNMTYRQPLGTLTFDKERDVSVRSVAYGSGFIKSNDGINWINLGNSSLLLGSGQYGISGFYDGVKHYLMKYDNLNNGNLVYYSYNGIIYNTVNKGVLGFGQHYSVINYNGYIYCMGNNSSIGLAHSYDGLNWLVSISGIFPKVTDIIFIGTMWIAGLFDSSTTPPIIYSYDGIRWSNSGVTILNGGSMTNIGGGTIYTDEAFASGRDSMVWNGKICVAVGAIVSVGSTGSIMYSRNGLEWKIAVLSPALTSGTELNFVDYNGKYWLTGGSIGYSSTFLYRSEDGIYWTQITNTTGLFDNLFRSGKWYRDKWILSGKHSSGYYIIYSYDGVNWYDTLSIGSDYCNFIYIDDTSKHRIDYPPNRTFVCGAGSKIIFSDTNSRGNWVSAFTVPFSTRVNQIRRGQNILVAGGNGTHAMAYSLDWGYKWTGIGNQIFTTECTALWYDNNIWVGLGDGNTIGYSYDGVTWFVASGNLFSTKGLNIIYKDGIWVAVGQDSAVGIRYSTDGINWNLPDTNPFTSGRSFYTVTKTYSYWIIGGQSTNIYGLSGDGKNWIKRTLTDLSSTGDMIVGYDDNSGQVVASTTATDTQAYYSFDAINWVVSGAGANDGGNNIIYNGEYWILPRTEVGAEIGTSINGIDWETQDVSLGVAATSVSTTDPNVPYVHIQHPTMALGENADGSSMAISCDGLKWEILPHIIFTRAHRVLWNGVMWIAAGEGSNTLAYSYNGILWTGLGTDMFDTAAYDLLWDGTNWYAVGSGTDNTIAYSSDGINWFGLGKPLSTTSLRGISWNRTNYVVTGTDGSNTLFYSTDPPNVGIWSVVSNAQISTLGYSVRYFGPGRRFIAVGTGTNKAVYSDDDGITWNTLAVTGGTFPTDGFKDIAYNRELAVLVGDNTGGGDNLGKLPIGSGTYVTMINTLIGASGATIPMSITSFRGVCWNGLRFVAVGDTSGYIHSHDGSIWYNTQETSSIFDVSVNSVMGNPGLGPIVVESALHMKKDEVLMLNNKLLF